MPRSVSTPKLGGPIADLPRGPPGRASGERHALRVAPVHPQIPDGLRGVLIGSLQDGEAVALEVARPEEERPPRVRAIQQSSVATWLNREGSRTGLFGKFRYLLPRHLLELRSEAVLFTATVLQPG